MARHGETRMWAASPGRSHCGERRLMSLVSVDRSGAFTRLAEPPASDALVDVGEISDFQELDALSDQGTVVLRASSYSDGRVFGLARQLRQRGFAGTLILEAKLLPDQLPMATSCGVDEILISDDHALRCTEPQWRLKAEGERFGYQRATARNLVGGSR